MVGIVVAAAAMQRTAVVPDDEVADPPLVAVHPLGGGRPLEDVVEHASELSPARSKAIAERPEIEQRDAGRLTEEGAALLDPSGTLRAGVPVTAGEILDATVMRAEALDTFVYALAAMQLLYTRYNRRSIWEQLERKLTPRVAQAAVAAPVVAPRAVRRSGASSFVTSW